MPKWHSFRNKKPHTTLKNIVQMFKIQVIFEKNN